MNAVVHIKGFISGPVSRVKEPLQIQRHKPDASDPHTIPPGSLSLLVNATDPNQHITTESSAISRLHRVFMQTA